MKNYCNICNSDNANYLYEGILKCANCTHAYADISLNADELQKIYSKNYL